MYTIIETQYFRTRAAVLLDAMELAELTSALARNPNAGAVIPGSGGCRKLRWALPGKGKSGGVRVVYINYLAHGAIYLVTIYAKAVEENIPAHLLRAMKDTIDEIRNNDR